MQLENQFPKTYSFSSEFELNSDAEIKLWQQVHQAKFNARDGVELAYAKLINPNTDRAIVISSGRVESYIKYRELFLDIYRQGYSIYCLDHRGQGLSQRITQDPEKGHIDNFTQYIDDFEEFIEYVVVPQKHSSLSLIGHSMGGAIGTLYINRHPDTFVAATFSSPMFGIKLPANKHLITMLARQLNSFTKGKEPNYVLGGKGYEKDPFEKNDLTHCKARYENYKAFYSAIPKIKVGSPTNQWLLESLSAGEQAMLAACHSPVPLLMLQAEQDTVVDNKAQDLSVSDTCHKEVIPKAKHEIFMEKDTPRSYALSKMFNFLEQAQDRHLSGEGR